MEIKVMTNVLQALGGYDPDYLDQEFFNQEVPEDTFDDEGAGTDFLDIPHFPKNGRKSYPVDDAKIVKMPTGDKQSINCMVVKSQNTTSMSDDTLRPSVEDRASEHIDVDAVYQCLKNLTDDDDLGYESVEENEEDDLDFHFSAINDCVYFADEPFKGNRTLELIDLLVRISLSYASEHGPIDQEEFKRLYYRIDFLKFSMFNEVTSDDLLGFKFLSGLVSYEQYDARLTTLEQHDT